MFKLTRLEQINIKHLVCLSNASPKQVKKVLICLVVLNGGPSDLFCHNTGSTKLKFQSIVMLLLKSVVTSKAI